MRGLFALILIAVLIAVATYLADYPGHVEIVWQDWQIDTSVGVLLCAVLAIAIVLWAVVAFLASLVRLPGDLRRRLRLRRERLGHRAVTRGLLAIAEGDTLEAERQADRAHQFLPEAPLTLLLRAQAAQLGRDEAAVRRGYTAMLEQPALSFAGLRGLLSEAMRRGDHATAMRLAEEARVLRPKSPWLTENLLALETRVGRWDKAAATLEEAVRRGVVSAATARHHRAVILYEQSRAAEQARNLGNAAKLAGKAQGYAPDLAPLAVQHARVLLNLGRKRAAAKAIERAWRTAPHPDLARAYEIVHVEDPPLARVAAFETLAAQDPASPESELALADAALNAKLWGEARRHLTLAATMPPPGGPSRRLCLMMARLEEGEHGNAAAARDWFDRAVNASGDPHYVCGRCGVYGGEWHSTCPHCSGFDTLVWRVPAPAALPLHPAPDPAAALEPAASVPVPAGPAANSPATP